jgi:hypothetical protein
VTVTLVAADDEYIAQIVRHLRPRESARATAIGMAAFTALVRDEISRSVIAYAGLVDGRCGALWGVKTAELLAREGTMWLLGSTLIDQNPITFLRHSRRSVLALRGSFATLSACVVSDYRESRRWLLWLGFEVGPDQDGLSYCELR